MAEFSLPLDVSTRDKYAPAMEMTDPAEAARYFEACVEHTQTVHDKTREEAEELERNNLGYFAGYYSHETRQRVERLFQCAHPILGPAGDTPPDPLDVLLLGMKAGSEGGTRLG